MSYSDYMTLLSKKKSKNKKFFKEILLEIGFIEKMRTI